MARRGIAVINDSALEAGLKKMGFVQENQASKCTADRTAAQRAVIEWIDHRFYNKKHEDTMHEINSLKITDSSGKEDSEKTKLMRKQSFDRLLANNSRFRFNEKTGRVEETPGR